MHRQTSAPPPYTPPPSYTRLINQLEAFRVLPDTPSSAVQPSNDSPPTMSPRQRACRQLAPKLHNLVTQLVAPNAQLPSNTPRLERAVDRALAIMADRNSSSTDLVHVERAVDDALVEAGLVPVAPVYERRNSGDKTVRFAEDVVSPTVKRRAVSVSGSVDRPERSRRSSAEVTSTIKDEVPRRRARKNSTSAGGSLDDRWVIIASPTPPPVSPKHISGVSSKGEVRGRISFPGKPLQDIQNHLSSPSSSIPTSSHRRSRSQMVLPSHAVKPIRLNSDPTVVVKPNQAKIPQAFHPAMLAGGTKPVYSSLASFYRFYQPFPSDVIKAS
jgi:hypothetical protein